MNRNMNQQQSRLAALIRKKQEERKRPSNFALWWMWGFFNVLALLFDLISASTVYHITAGNYLYALLTFFAGFIPLLMHEFGFIRAAANKVQKGITIVGASTSIITILVVGIIAGLVNISGVTRQATTSMEKGLMITLILISLFHALLAAAYFYTDSGIQRNHRKAETMELAYERIDEMVLAGKVMAALSKALNVEDRLLETFDDPEALQEITAKLSGNQLAVEPVTPPPAATYKKNGSHKAEPLPIAAADVDMVNPTLQQAGKK